MLSISPQGASPGATMFHLPSVSLCAMPKSQKHRSLSARCQVTARWYHLPGIRCP